MSFDSEWSQLKADAAGQQSAHTRLNQLAGAGADKEGVASSMRSAKALSDHKKSHANDDELIAASLRHRDGSAVSVSEISKTVK
ncbi:MULTISPECIES: hypothetical protein [unclassified Streptomyces]|uniref:hypothetical protein n=1 Tax=unclassified Streptomyces TaxID=2593676 RepID=UPI00336A5415